MRAQGSIASLASLAHGTRGKSPIHGAIAGSYRCSTPHILILILLGTTLLGSLCIAGSAADYYSGQEYKFGTVYSPDWDYLWDASCCSDNTKPCCYDPRKIHESTFEIIAPIVDEPTEITISVMVRTKRMASCMDMAELKIVVKPHKGLTVIKKHMGGDGTFSFTGTGFSGDCGMSSFNLSPSNGYAFACHDLVPGTYTITELALPGWDLNSITVVGTDPTNYQITGRSITIIPQPGESPAVTFTNAKRGSIVVDKIASPGGFAQEFEFKPSYGESFKLSNTSDPKDSGQLLPGTYSISETAVPGWDLAEIEVKGIASKPIIDLATGTISFYLAPGETASVTYTNRKKQADISGYVWDEDRKSVV